MRKDARDALRATSCRQTPWRRLVNPYPPLGILSADQIESIHDTSLRVLEELGIEFLLDEAREHLKAVGAEVTGQCVRFDRALVMELVSRAPPEFTLHPRNPERAVTFGGNHIAFNSVGGPANASDLDGGRRQGNFADFKN